MLYSQCIVSLNFKLPVVNFFPSLRLPRKMVYNLIEKKFSLPFAMIKRTSSRENWGSFFKLNLSYRIHQQQQLENFLLEQKFDFIKQRRVGPNSPAQKAKISLSDDEKEWKEVNEKKIEFSASMDNSLTFN